jgi:hypothetical protein
MAWENQMAVEMILAEKGVGGEVMCPDWGRMLHIHPQQHRSRWDHNQGSPRPDSPIKQLANNSGINDLLTNWLEQWFKK